MNRIVLDTNKMPWRSGLDLISKMAPEFRANLGPAELLRETYAKSRHKILLVDPVTTRRVELVEDAPGYADLTNAYHDSVEECFVLDGHCHLSGEGDMHTGYYFWRPPGWVHAARTAEGFRALLMMEGNASSEGSGPVSRRIRPDEEAGTNALYDDGDLAVGPRGWVKHLDTSLLHWQRGRAFARCEGSMDGYGLDQVSFKVLSKNPHVGAQSLLVRLDPGYRQIGSGRHSAAQIFFVISGKLTIGDLHFEKGWFMYRPAGTIEEPMESDRGATLFMKTDAWLDFELV